MTKITKITKLTAIIAVLCLALLFLINNNVRDAKADETISDLSYSGQRIY